MTSSTNQRYATLLASKCLLSPNDAELEALLGLKLDIDWLAQTTGGKTLFELGFTAFRDQTVFDKWWAGLAAENPNWSPWSNGASANAEWSNMPCMGWALTQGRWDTVLQWMKTDPGTPAQWSALAQCPVLKNKALTEWWPPVQQRAQAMQLPSSLMAGLGAYRAENLWLTSNTQSELLQNMPKVWTEKHAMLWWKGMCQRYKGNQVLIKPQEQWRLLEFLRQSKGWKKWTSEDWSTAMNVQPPGFLGFHAPTKMLWGTPYASKSAPDGLSLSESFQKSVNWSKVSTEFFWKEVSEMMAVSASNVDPTRLKAWASSVKKGLVAAGVTGSIFENGWLMAGLDTSTLRTTQFSKSALDIWDKAPKEEQDTWPSSWQQTNAVINNLTRSLPATTQLLWTSPERMSAMFANILRQSQNNPTKMSHLVDSIEWSKTAKKDSPASPLYAVTLVPWATRGATEAPEELKKEWAEVFWKSVLFMETANQHYWLKKAAEDPTLHVALRFWNDQFQAQLEAACKTRKKTPLISTLLNKMLLLNQVAQHTPLDVKSGRARSKM